MRPDDTAPDGVALVHPAPRAKRKTSRQILCEMLWEQAGGRCGICRQPMALSEVHIDHVAAFSTGGPDHWENLQPAHQRCNSLKHTSPWPAPPTSTPTQEEQQAIQNGDSERAYELMLERLNHPIDECFANEGRVQAQCAKCQQISDGFIAALVALKSKSAFLPGRLDAIAGGV